MKTFDPILPFQPGDHYPCPSCRIGQIAHIPLMETWGCSFCGQLFLTNSDQRSLQTVDPILPQVWYWNGSQWDRQITLDLQPAWLWKSLCVLLIGLPTLLVGGAAYAFPTEPDSFLAELPLVWTGLTFLTHLLLVLYLISEYYQVPFAVYGQALRRQWLRQLQRLSTRWF